MNKFHIVTFIVIIGIFGTIIYTTQKDSIGKQDLTNQTPSLPPANDALQFISPQTALNQPQQGQQQRQQATQQQQQQQAQQQPQQQVQPVIQGPLNASVSATIKTSRGDISVILFGKEAPNTVTNFINKAKNDYYKNMIFHRVEDWVVQGGDPLGNGTGGGQMLAEQTTKPFLVGSLGIARGTDPKINNDSQFFITKKDADWLNGQYTNFGIVTSGMDIVYKMKIGDKILGITTE
ncbi:MAG TPA: peptidylprolyl isomerase [Candidatus Saccharimonadales bacterium]|nr:peptidylprolyl isomerase [Candidatus Saccharimonadales bacterium]